MSLSSFHSSRHGFLFARGPKAEPVAEPVADPAPEVVTETVVETLPAERTSRFEAFRPDLWSSLAEAQAALRARIQQEHAARTQTRAISLEAVLDLAFLDQRTEAQEIELAQHRIWAERLRNVDGVLHAKLADVAALTSLEEARAYAASVEDGWQT